MFVRYVAYNWLGRRLEGILEAQSEDAAREIIERDQLIPYRLRAVVRRRSLVQLAPALFRPGDQPLIEFTRELASLLRSGLPLRQALTSLREETRSLGFREALRQVIQTIEGGGSFSEGCSQQPSVFPGFYARLLHVAEATGAIGTVLQRLAQTLERRKAVKDRVKAALVYPAISLAVAAIATFVLMTYSLPALVRMLGEFGGELPATTALLVRVSDFLDAFAGYVVGAMVAVPAAVWIYTRSSRGAMLRDRLLLRIPMVGKVVRVSNMFSVTSTLGMLVGAGVPQVQALPLTKEGVSSLVVREGLDKVTKEISAGVRLSEAFRRQAVFSPLLCQAIANAEMTGNLGEALDGLIEYYEKETGRAVAGATELIQPAIILVVAGVVGFVAVAVVSGIYSTLASIA